MAKKIMSTGVGESRTFNDPAAVEPERDWTVNGVAWADIDPAVRQAIPYELTDQGREEVAAKKHFSPHKVVIGDDLDKDLRRRLEEGLRGNPAERPSAALAQAAEPYLRPGMTPGFLNPEMVRLAGTNGYKPVVDEKGDLVRVGEMILAEIPSDVAQRRIDEPAEKAKALLKRYDELFDESSGRVAREGITPAALRDLSSVSGSDFSDEGDTNLME